MSRKFSFSRDGVDIMLFLKQLQNDECFNDHEEMTEAYLEEVGYELKYPIEKTREIINLLVLNSILIGR